MSCRHLDAMISDGSLERIAGQLVIRVITIYGASMIPCVSCPVCGALALDVPPEPEFVAEEPASSPGPGPLPTAPGEEALGDVGIDPWSDRCIYARNAEEIPDP